MNPPPCQAKADSAESAKSNGRTLKLKGSEDPSDPAQPAAMDVSTDSPSEPNAPADEKPASSTEPPSDTKSSEPRGNTEEDAQPGRSRRGRQRRPKRDPNTPSANPMSLTDLKSKSTQELIDMAREMGLENMARSRKQDIIFALLKRHAKSGEDIWGDGVLEILQDGFGFLRSADSSFLAGPDDIYVSPSQIRRFNLRTWRYGHRYDSSTQRTQSATLRC
jgi:transcription termination factor Rho